MYSIVYYKLGLGPFAALVATGFICMHYSFVITPVNYSLATVSACARVGPDSVHTEG
ncbi:hypothetical protein BC827DRAFT_1146160 [Russula dissimulans]|nr:hypothetical protein BC827DRAFT_1146160 [Russula dissimulans]